MRRLPILAGRSADSAGSPDSADSAERSSSHTHLHPHSRGAHGDGHEGDEHSVLAGGALVVLVALDEAATIAFAGELTRELLARGVRPTIVLESSVPLGEAPAWLGGLVGGGAEWASAPARDPGMRADWARVLSGPGPFVVVGEGAAALVRSNLMVAVGHAAGAALSPRFRRIRPKLDAILEDGRPAFARWLAGRMCVQGGPFVR